MILGVGVDVVDVARLGERLESTPELAGRLFTPAERSLPLRSLAGRMAAKEAVAKALGSPGDLSWLDVEVTNDPHGRPVLGVSGACAERAEALGGSRWHLSISHDAGIATAFVILESA